MPIVAKRIYLWSELFILFGLVPLAMYFAKPPSMNFVMLWSMALVTFVILRNKKGFSYRMIWDPAHVTLDNMRPILIRFAFISFAMAVFTWFFHNELFFKFVSEKPFVWAAVMVLYPILSVYPQELVYRVFFFRRYRYIFGHHGLMILASGLAFGYVHIIFHNLISIAFSFIGGVLFADTYQRTRSFLLATIEHSLYGCFIFTVGLGWFFYHGAVK